MKIAFLVIALLDFTAAAFAPSSWRPNRPMAVLLGIICLLLALLP